MAHGMPVVAPRAALRDFPLVEERHFWGIRSSEDLADKLAEALADRSKLDEVALAARRITEQNDWQILGERFLRVIMATVARKTNPGCSPR
jgi:glycosyltransferase involved in cell wall biosynthesis